MMMGTYDKALEDAQTAIRIDENFLKVCYLYLSNTYLFIVQKTSSSVLSGVKTKAKPSVLVYTW